MNACSFQWHYYIPGYFILPVQLEFMKKNQHSATHVFPRLRLPLPWSIINIQRQQNQAGPSKRLFPDFRVDTWSCEHTYDPIRFINHVRPLLPQLTSFLPVKLL